MNSYYFIIFLTLAGAISSFSNFTVIESNIISICAANGTMYDCADAVVDEMYTLLSNSGLLSLFLNLLKMLFSTVSALVVNPHFMGLIFMLILVSIFAKFVWPTMACTFRAFVFCCRPFTRFIRIRPNQDRYQHPHYGRLFAQGDEGLEGYVPESTGVSMHERFGGRAGTSNTPSAPRFMQETTAPPPPASDAPVPDLIVENKPVANTSVAANPQDMIKCEEHRNTLFSGIMRPIRTWKQRKFPPYEMIYKQKGGEYNLMYNLGTFTWLTSQTPGSVLYSANVALMMVAHPRYKFLRTLWTYFRSGLRIVIAPTCNSAASGILIAGVTPSTEIAGVPWENIGLVPHDYLQASSNDHIEIEVPFPFIDHWLTSYNDSTSSIAALTPWTFFVSVLSPLQVGVGSTTSLTYTVYIQLTDIHAKWPQAAGSVTQGLINITNTTISNLRDSTLPLHLTGDTTNVSVPAFGFDHPMHNSNPFRMMRRVFQGTHHSKGGLEGFSLNFNGSSMEPQLWKGEDEMSIPWIASRPNISYLFNLSTTNTSGSIITSWSVGPQSTTVDDTKLLIIDAIINTAEAWECDYIVYRFYIPKTPYQNGKYLAIVTLGITPPATLTSTTLAMSVAPSLTIDLAAPDMIHELKVPWSIIREYMGTNPVTAVESTTYPILSLYAMNPMTASLGAPTAINCYAGYHYENLRLLNPNNINLVSQAEDNIDCYTTSGKINIKPDSVLTATVDDFRSIKQAWLAPSRLYSATLPKGGAEFNFQWASIFTSNTWPFAGLYRVFTGSVRFHITFSNWTGTDFVVLQWDRMNRNAGLAQPGMTSAFDSLFWNVSRVAPPFNAVPDAHTYFNSLSTSFNTNGSTNFMMKVDSTEKELIVEVPIITPRGFWYRGDNNSWGPSFTALAVGSAPLVNIQICVSAGDDLEAHFISNGIIAMSPNVQTGISGTYPSIY